MFKNNDKVIFFGDSITHSNKTHNEGFNVIDCLGNGYVNFVNAHYTIYEPNLNLRIVNEGVSGDRSIDLINRIDSVLAQKPNHVFIMVGINDVWRNFDLPQIKEQHTTKEMYQENIEILVNKFIENNINVVLLSPFHMSKNTEIRNLVDEFINVLWLVAKKYKIKMIDLQKEFDFLMERQSPFVLSGDRVHPNLATSMFIKDIIIKNI